MSDISLEEILEHLQLQLQEVEMLQAMFPGEKEMIWHDPTVLLDVKEFVSSNGKLPATLRYITFDVNLVITSTKDEKNVECKVQTSITLPSSYPVDCLRVSVISNDLTRNEQSLLNQDLHSYISTLDRGGMMTLDVISWLQASVDQYYNTCSHTQTISETHQSVEDDQLSLMWLYMHHIYNKEKRKSIIHWADELSLTGFSLPGKPGVVYIEGLTRNVETYFERLRRLSWKRMSCKLKETCEKRTFSDFQELCFDAHGGRDYHMDMGQFFLFLKQNDLGYMFQELFGVEGHGSK